MTETETTPRASVIICTYRRDRVLVDSIAHLLDRCEAAGAELLVVDQLEDHDPEVQARLEAWAHEGCIRYMNLAQSGLTHARNVGADAAQGGLTHARNVGADAAPSGILIYFDDDVVPGHSLVQRHIDNYADQGVASVAGQVLDVGKKPAHAPGSFHHNAPIGDFDQLYGANFSMRKQVYERIGGSDKNLTVHAYSEDRILADKLARGGHRVRYDPEASLVHLMHESGGCRITDDTQNTPESEKSFSMLYWIFLTRPSSTDAPRRALWSALRLGPLRRQVVVQPWRQPRAWHGFGVAAVNAYRKARTASRPHEGRR